MTCIWGGIPRYVYYAERDGLIKIGSSINPAARAQTLKARLLGVESAAEPGVDGYRLEWVCHERFAHLKVEGEWFLHEGELAEHVATLPKVDIVARRARRL